jgi:hypothetical protein
MKRLLDIMLRRERAIGWTMHQVLDGRWVTFRI